MIAEPTATPLTKPPLPTEATDVLLLLHVPPLVASLNKLVLPLQTDVVPAIAGGVAGSGLTVTAAVCTAVPHTLVLV